MSTTAKALEADFFNLLDEENDFLTLVVKSHYSIDKMLDLALFECLPQADALELKRVSMLLKVDFLTALGGLNQGTRKLFELANSFRNTFAHDPYAIFNEKNEVKVAKALTSHKPPLVQENFESEVKGSGVLKTLFAVCFLQAWVVFEKNCKSKVTNIVAAQLVSEALGKKIKQRPESMTVEEDFAERCGKLMAELYPGIEIAGDWN
ncbi:hypothetical protein [Pseudomonas sp.]|uniref:hypothetical protein n=1 Tax=Pseudomonas sp. TaxID=306 RepID=UPI0031DE7FA1